MIKTLLRTKDLTVRRGDKCYLQGISFELTNSETLAVVGPKGSCKGLLLKTLMGFQEGKLEGELWKSSDVRMGLVSRHYACLGSLTVFENLSLVLKQMGVSSRSVLGEEIEEALRSVGLWQDLKTRLHEKVEAFEDFTRLRLDLAKTLLLRPQILLLDQPTTLLDPETKTRYESLIENLKQHMSVIWVTHDIEQAARVADKVLFLKHGKMIEFGSAEFMFTTPEHSETENYMTRRLWDQNKPIMLRLDQNLHELRALVLTMAGYVEESVDMAMKGLVLRDKALLKQVWTIEEEINRLHKKIDNACFKVLACQSPVAADLRLVLAIIKINVDLERMGDLVCKTARAIDDYLQGPPNLMVQQIRQMASTVMRMSRDSFDAFMDNDLQKAQEVLVIDDAVDEFRNKMSVELKEGMKSPIADIGMMMNLLSVVRNLERLADHATNISEEVIFYLTGVDVRHKHTKIPKEESDEGENSRR